MVGDCIRLVIFDIEVVVVDGGVVFVGVGGVDGEGSVEDVDVVEEDGLGEVILVFVVVVLFDFVVVWFFLLVFIGSGICEW